MADESRTVEDLEEIQRQSESQERPEQKVITSVSSKIRQRLHNLPDPTNPPLGYDDHKAFDRVFPYINIPALHPKNHGDTVIFNDPDAPTNKLYLGDNLEVLRTLKSQSIDLIYIDPPFFSGRNYNVIWGDTNEVRTFGDIWEGGINSYLIWLNARLWEMRRVLKNTGSIYVHCDWHASHYIKAEMDKIFGYENFRNEIVWKSTSAHNDAERYGYIHQALLFYTKSKEWTFNATYQPYDDEYIDKYYRYKEPNGRRYASGDVAAAGPGPARMFNGKLLSPPQGSHWRYSQERINNLLEEGRIFFTKNGFPRYKRYLDEMPGMPSQSLWSDKEVQYIVSWSREGIGYPTQKPEGLLERIVSASSNEGDIIADFFVGGGTTVAVAQRLGRRFIGVDSSRVAISVSLDRLVKLGENMSGVESNISAKEEAFQMGLQTEGITEKVPNIEVNYLGVYPIEKFKNLSHDEFISFVLTAYGASRNTGETFIDGFKPPAQQEPILVGPADPEDDISPKDIQKFFDAIKSKLEPNKMVRAKIIAWKFSRQTLKYLDVLKRYCEKNNLPLELEAIPLNSKEFRARILQRMPNVEDAELFLRFSKPPAIGGIKVKQVGNLEYEFEAEDALSTNEDGWLVNCQWDFDYQEGHFAADKTYVLSRGKERDIKRGEIFKAILIAKHKFEKAGEFTVACKVQDNLAGETILATKVSIS